MTGVKPNFFEAFRTENDTIKIQGVKETPKFYSVPDLIIKFREIQKSINPLIDNKSKIMCFGKPISGQIKNLENSNNNISNIISSHIRRGSIKFYFSYLIILSKEDGNNIIQIFKLSPDRVYSSDYDVVEITNGTFSDNFKEELIKLKKFIEREREREGNSSFVEEIYNYISGILEA
jgi:hypothetical protein